MDRLLVAFVLELVSIETYAWYLSHERNSSILGVVIMARRGDVTQLNTFGGRNSSSVDRQRVLRPVPSKRVLGESTNVVVVTGARGAMR